MKNKNLKKIGLNFEKTTISRLMQTLVRGGAQNVSAEAEAGSVVGTSGKQTERGETCVYTGCN